MLPCLICACYFAVTEITKYLHRLLLIYRYLSDTRNNSLTTEADWDPVSSLLMKTKKSALYYIPTKT